MTKNKTQYEYLIDGKWSTQKDFKCRVCSDCSKEFRRLADLLAHVASIETKLHKHLVQLKEEIELDSSESEQELPPKFIKRKLPTDDESEEESSETDEDESDHEDPGLEQSNKHGKRKLSSDKENDESDLEVPGRKKSDNVIGKKRKLDEKIEDNQINKIVINHEHKNDRKNEYQNKVKDKFNNKDNAEDNQEKSEQNKTDKESVLDQMKEKLNKLSTKKKSKKKKKTVVEHKLSDEDNLDLKLDRTISIALPASIILNAQTSELKAYLIGQVARCAAIFNVNEIVVFDEYCTDGNYNDDECEDDKVTCVRQMANLLRYLECPQYLRKSLFPLHKDFRSAGVINPLNTKHHLSFEDESEFREGVVNSTRNGKSFVYVGLQKEALINKEIEPGSRVTVQLDCSKHTIFEDRSYFNGKVVSPYLPTKKLNYYWGFDVRIAKSLSKVIEECPFDDKYDLVIGTSDKGDKLDSIEEEIDDFKHALIVFGGLKGLENAMHNDSQIENKDPKQFFSYYLNTCPQQGSNVIRTEEALLISLSHLNSVLYD